MIGILVHGDNHFIVRGPPPDDATALATLAMQEAGDAAASGAADRALDLLQREAHFKRFDAADWARVAALSAKLGKSDEALKYAILTHKEHWPAETAEKLALILG